MLEYPSYKRQGLDMSIKTKYFGAEFIVNDFKEVAERTSSFMGGGRMFLRPFSRVQVGVSVAGDLDEYEGLIDSDGDGYPDEVDAYPDDDRYVTEKEYYSGQGASTTTINNMVSDGIISGLDRSDINNYQDESSKTGFWAGDIGILVVDNKLAKMNIYSQFAQSINTGGWGFSAPGVNLSIGNIITIFGEYNQKSDEFIFGYYNETYDLERAKYVDDGSGNLTVQTKKEKLESAVESRGYTAGVTINFFDLIKAKGTYQDIRGDVKDRSVRGELEVKTDMVTMISKAKAFYIQNNVEKFEWKSESTLMGGVVGISLGDGASLDFKYIITFEDVNGDGEIDGDDETIRNISVSTSAVF